MRFSWRSNLAWRVLAEAISPAPIGPASVAVRFPELFETITVYHAARPRNVLSYYERGLQLADYAAIEDAAAAIFLSGEFPELSRASFDRAIERLSSTDDRRSFVDLDKSGLLTDASGFLAYGSERLCAIAAGLNSPYSRDYRQVLKLFGVPTLFRIALPLEYVHASDLSELVEAVSHELSSRIAGEPRGEVDFSFELQKPLPPWCILSHYHPRVRNDP